MTVKHLSIIKCLSERFHSGNIIYCHWKSNEHLYASVAGLTDLDILVNRNQINEIEQILSSLGFKRFEVNALRKYTAIDDFFAIDPETGVLVHLHLHYRLVLGERFLKGYHLPWEKYILERRQLDKETGLYIIDPNLEAILLLIRTALKFRTRDRLHRSKDNLAETDFVREMKWISKRINYSVLAENIQTLIGKEYQDQIINAIETGENPTELLQNLKQEINIYRFNLPLKANLIRWLRELYMLLTLVSKKYLKMKIAYNRVSPRGGSVIVFLGADGSGKSTVTGQLIKWLSKKIDVEFIYFGSGDGPGSIARSILHKFARLSSWFFRVAGKNKVITDNATSLPGKNKVITDNATSLPGKKQENFRLTNQIKEIGKIIYSLSLAQEKKRKLKKMWFAKGRGCLVICDRYPQSQFLGIMDGPHLSQYLNHHNWLFRKCAIWEAEVFQQASKYSPDLIIKFQVTPEIAVLRKNDMGIKEIYERNEIVKQLVFGENSEIVTINADSPLEDVLLQTKKAIWKVI